MKIPGNPHIYVGIIFLTTAYLAFREWHWRQEQFGFLLLLYFIVTLGIRLDDISKQLGARHKRPSQIPDESKTVTDILEQIRRRLEIIDRRLTTIATRLPAERNTANEEPDKDPPQKTDAEDHLKRYQGWKR
jgi:hypothetical protein